MAIKIVIANKKGGSGKSTLATNLATSYSMVFEKEVVLLDTDEQSKTTTKFNNNRKTITFPIVTNPQAKEIEQLNSDYEIMIIDTGGFNTPQTKAFIATADVVLFPLNMGSVEMDTFIDFHKIVNKLLKVSKKAPQLMIVPSRIHHSVSEYSMHDYFLELLSVGYKITPAIRHRKVYQDVHVLGKGVIQSSNTKAKLEMIEVSDFILKEVQNG